MAGLPGSWIVRYQVGLLEKCSRDSEREVLGQVISSNSGSITYVDTRLCASVARTASAFVH
jgi:hypothetical protein